MKISEIYHPNPITIKENATIKEALKMILNQSFNSLVVLDKDNKLVGVLSLQDIAGAVVPKEFQENISIAEAMYKHDFFEEMSTEVQKELVSEIMRKEFVTVTLESNIMAVTADFLKNDLYIIPVLDDNDNMIGIITRSEIKKAFALTLKN